LDSGPNLISQPRLTSLKGENCPNSIQAVSLDLTLNTTFEAAVMEELQLRWVLGDCSLDRWLYSRR